MQENRFDRFINDVMFYFYLMAVMVGITGLTGFEVIFGYIFLKPMKACSSQSGGFSIPLFFCYFNFFSFFVFHLVARSVKIAVVSH